MSGMKKINLMIHKRNKSTFLYRRPCAPDREKSSFKPGLIVSTNRERPLGSAVCPGEEPRQSIIISNTFIGVDTETYTSPFFFFKRKITRYSSYDF